MMSRAIAIAIVVALLLVSVENAHARRRGGLAPAQLVLGRAAVGECDLYMPDCEAGVWHTLARRRAEFMEVRALRGDHRSYSLAMMFFQYCAVFRGAHRGRNRWVRGLPDHPGPPLGWPREASWDRHEPGWHRIYLRAGLFLRGLVPDPCDGEPTHTGSATDAAGMPTHKWKLVDCGDTRRNGREQFFWERRR